MDALVNMGDKAANLLSLPPIPPIPSLQTPNRVSQQSHSPLINAVNKSPINPINPITAPSLSTPPITPAATTTQNVLNAVLNLPQTFNNLRTLNNLTKSFSNSTENDETKINGFPELSRMVKEEAEKEDDKHGRQFYQLLLKFYVANFIIFSEIFGILH